MFFIVSCYKENSNTEKTNKNNINKETIFSFGLHNMEEGCSSSSEMICIINASIKCTLDPLFKECKKYKNRIPPFIFMQDENLKRPTTQSYKITKLVPRNDGTIEVVTNSSCNGNWFGLCNGNIIYVMKNINSNWHIIDIYAVEN
jgi:hypothetical protein